MSAVTAISAARPLQKAVRAQRPCLVFIAVFSMFVNILILAGPMFALQVYDRVLGSRSVETLVALAILMLFLVLIMAVLDHTRKRLLARAGANIALAMHETVIGRALATNPAQGKAATPAHLESMRRFFAAPAMAAVFDLPWVPFFFVAIGLLNPLLGQMALAGGILIFLVPVGQALAGYLLGSRRTLVQDPHADAIEWAEANPAAAAALGMQDNIRARWGRSHKNAVSDNLRGTDTQAWLAVHSQTLRILMQSAMIGVGAWLVIKGQISPGAIIAATVLLPRAYAPLDVIAQNLPSFVSLIRITRRLAAMEAMPPTTQKPLADSAELSLRQVTVLHSGARLAAVRLVEFQAPSGCIVGVHGPSGSGKSTLLQAIAGEIRPAGGEIRIGGERPERIGGQFGYMPQSSMLLPGTIIDNIMRFAPDKDASKAICAAQRAGAHAAIQAMPEGYHTRLGLDGRGISTGLGRQVALARALFGKPKVVLLDEPFNDFDTGARRAFVRAVEMLRGDGHIVVVASQHTDRLTFCDQVLSLIDGSQVAFGPLRAADPSTIDMPRRANTGASAA